MKPSVLIVDDEEVIRYGIARLFEDTCITYMAMNGREAIEILDKHRDIDVIFCDIIMPEMEGIETIEKIRSYSKDIVIIIITASSPAAVCDAMRKGANNFMRKPLDIDQLEMTISSLIN